MKRCVISRAFRTVPLVAAAILSAQTLGAAAIVGVSPKTAIDTMSGVRALGGDSVTVCYGPEVAGLAPGQVDHVVVRRVVNLDAAGMATNDMFTSVSEATVTGESAVSRVTQGNLQRWIHVAYDAGGHPIGEPLVADFALPTATSASGNTVVDTRTNSIELVMQDSVNLPLVYSTTWATNGVPARLEITCSGGNAVSEVLAAAAPADGVHPFRARKSETGTYTLTYSILDATDAVLDTASVSYFYEKISGLAILIK